MKQYVIDEIRPEDEEKLGDYLSEHFGPPVLERVYWMPLDPEYYTTTQAAHEACHPLYFALELRPGALAGEFLIRTHHRVRCDCMAYANDAQREWLINQMEAIIEQLNIIT